MVDSKTMSEKQLDLLRVAFSIGMHGAHESLSQMLGQTVAYRQPRVDLVDAREVADITGDAEHIIGVVFFQLTGNLEGVMMAFLREESARALLQAFQVMDEAGGSAELNDFQISAIEETGNILVGSFLNALAEATGLSMEHSPPQFAMDMAGAVLDAAIVEHSRYSETAIVGNGSLGDEKGTVEIGLLALLRPDSLDRLIGALEWIEH